LTVIESNDELKKAHESSNKNVSRVAPVQDENQETSNVYKHSQQKLDLDENF